jgi:hypothetical protein
MKKLLILLIGIMLTSDLYSQKFGPKFIEPDGGKSLISIYLKIENLKEISPKSKKIRKARNGYIYFSFALTLNTLYYNTEKNSLVGSYVSINSLDDTLNVVMNEENKDLLKLKIFYNELDKVVVIIEKRKRNHKVKLYYSDECILNRQCW